MSTSPASRMAVDRPTRFFLPGVLTVFLALVGAPALLPAAEGPALTTKEIQARLRTRPDLNFENVALGEVAAQISKLLDIPIQLDAAGLKRAGLSEKTPVTLHTHDLSANRALLRLLEPLRLQHVIRDGAVLITDSHPPSPPQQRVRFCRVGGMAVQNVKSKEEFLAEFQRLLKEELGFIRRVCRPTDEQYRGLEADGEEIIEQLSREFADSGGRRMDPLRGPVPLDSRTELLRLLTLAVDSRVPAEQAAPYGKELKLRQAHGRSAQIANIVALLDEPLYLSPGQRESILKAIDENWQEPWRQLRASLQIHDSSCARRLSIRWIMAIWIRVSLVWGFRS